MEEEEGQGLPLLTLPMKESALNLKTGSVLTYIGPLSTRPSLSQCPVAAEAHCQGLDTDTCRT